MSGIGGIAIVGMAGRFPRARDLDELWRNLAAGVDCIRDFADGELAAVPAELLADPAYVKSRGVLDDPELFDARLFDMTPRQAEVTDPQHRLFLECAHAALEDAGYDPFRYPGAIGVFGGVSLSTYFLAHLLTNPAAMAAAGGYQVGLGTDRDYLTTLVSYKLNLRGPSLNVQTACSTSLVAVVLACQSLLSYSCDMALAGGASVKLPQRTGYLYHPGGFDSADGRCRSFDARADGAVTGAGAGVVLLKRLDEALADGDPIRAVILGAAFNNDGAARIGFTAPGVEGQAEVVATAQALAGVDPETLSYVECHGSATPLGDPIEIAALTKAFQSRRRGFCAIGSIKSNIGHAAAAAGIAGLVKTTLALENGQLPPSLHFETPNPKIDFAGSPFYVNTQLTPWEPEGLPRRAGVSSFGLGGTNAHAILEQAPAPEPSGPSRPAQLLLLSAASEEALEAATDNLARHLGSSGEPLADVAYTLQVGRRELPYRRAVVAGSRQEAAEHLAGRRRTSTALVETTHRPVAFLLPGVGDHYPGMAQGLYDAEPAFRQAFDRAAELFRPHLGVDLRALVFPPEGRAEPDPRRLFGRVAKEGGLDRASHSQPAVFAIEIALAALWAEWGIRPAALLGYSLGEYTAACLAGVWSLEDAVRLIAERALLLESLPPGAMLAVPLALETLAARLPASLDFAALNHREMAVLAGAEEAIEAFAAELAAEGIPARRLPGSHAFHSRAMEPAAPALAHLLTGIEARPPRIPWVSNVTGTWIRPEEATAPAYWLRHLTGTVQWSRGLATLWQDPARVLLEVGPGLGLSSLALQSAAGAGDRQAIPTLPHRDDRTPDTAFALGALGRLWLAGMTPDWPGFAAHERRRRVRLPTYPFERRRYWVEPGPGFAAAGSVGPGAILADYGAALREEENSPGAARTQTTPPSPDSTAHGRPRLRTAFVAPETLLEREIARIEGDLLGIAEVGRDDNFFELGGNSITAALLANRLQESLAAELPLTAIFDAPSVGELAAHLERELPQEVGAAFSAGGEIAEGEWEIPVAAWAPGSSAPLSFAQERLWFLDRLEGAAPTYNIPAGLRFTGRLSLPALAGALSALVERHTALRTTFGDRGGEPRQVIGEPFAVLPFLTDLEALPAERREAEARRVAAIVSALPFDLAAGPLLRGALLRLEPESHAAVFSLHHIISDGWSVGVFSLELSELYQAALEGRASPLPPLPLQYADYAVWQRRQLAGPALERRLAFFRDTLAGVPPLELPTDRPRPPVQTFRGASVSFKVEPAVATRLTELARASDGSLFMALLAGFAAVLARASGQEDFALGTPVAGRNRTQLEELIGFFVNTLVLRPELAGNPSSATLIERLRDSAVAAYAYQDLPFEKVVGELKLERDAARSPLFQALFVLQNAPGGALELPEVSLASFPSGFVAARFDLTLNVSEGKSGLAASLDYNTDLFDRPTASRWARQLAAAWTAAADTPEMALGDLPLVAAAERWQLVGEWAAGGPAPEPEHVARLILAQAERTPAAPALDFEGETLTYRGLATQARALAAHLAGQGFQPGDRAALLTERTPGLILGILATWLAGGAYVPLDPTYPAERLAFMLEDSEARLLLTEPGLLPQAEILQATFASVTPVVVLSVPYALSVPDVLPTSSLSPGLPAYLIYTSGSSGRPKGVVAAHRGLAAFVRAMIPVMEVGPESRVLEFASPCFDASAVQLFPVLAAGGCLVLHRNPSELAPAELLGFAEARGVTLLDLPAAVWRQAIPERAAAALPLPRQTRTYMTGGESLSREVLAEWAALAAPGARFLSSYGPTEATVTATLYGVGRAGSQALATANLPLGRPLPGVEVLLLDRGLAPVPLGAAGELYVGGVGLTQGYRGRPELTAAAFLPHPFPERAGSGAGARLYRTGDLARYRADGTLEFLGRADQQVKIRGFRVELGEIEAALAAHPEVAEAAVLVRGDLAGPTGPMDRRLVAYAVPAAGARLEPATLRAALRDRLPDYMVPAVFVALERMPLTPGGKLDRRALPRPEEGALGGDRPYVAPQGEIEEAVAAVWRELLGVARAGRDDSFFDLGGHSLLAARMAARLRERFAVEIPLRRLFEAPTLAAVARAVAEAGEDAAAPPPIAPVPRGGPLPLSFGQERLWFLDQLRPGLATDNMPSATALDGPFDLRALAGAFTALAARHETLRTRFPSADGAVVQEILPPAPFPLPRVDLSALPDAAAEGEAGRLAAAEARRPFDLARGPLLRALLLRLAPGRHLLLSTMHHIVSDGWSMGILTAELSAAYAALAAGEAPALPPLPIQYADFAAWQRGWLAGPVLEAQLDFWRRTLGGGLPALELPADRPRPAEESARGLRRPFFLREGGEALERLARRADATLFMVLVAAFDVLLLALTGETDLALGTPVAGRRLAELEGLIGLFVNTLVLRNDLSGDPTFLELLARVREGTLAALAHQDVPFERLVAELHPERRLSGSPFFQVLFVLQNAPAGAVETGALTLAPREAYGGMARFDLTVSLTAVGGGLAGWFEGKAERLDAATLERWAAAFGRLLAALAADPGRRLSQLSPLIVDAPPEEEMAELVATLAGFSDEEIDALLAEEEPGSI